MKLLICREPSAGSGGGASASDGSASMSVRLQRDDVGGWQGRAARACQRGSLHPQSLQHTGTTRIGRQWVAAKQQAAATRLLGRMAGSHVVCPSLPAP